MTPMFEAENIRDWRNHDVVDADGKKIGELEAIYVIGVVVFLLAFIVLGTRMRRRRPVR